METGLLFHHRDTWDFFMGTRIWGILAVRKAAGTFAWDKAAFFAGKACEKRAWAWLWVLGMHGWRRR